MKTEKLIGWLLIAGSAGVLIPYTALTMMFEYPSILRQEAEVVLTRFYEGGSRMIWTWFVFALIGIPLLPSYILIGQKLENRSVWVRIATTLGVVGLILQMIGLLRWTFVVPVLAGSFVNSNDEATKAAAIIAFKTIQQFAGVILGEHLGQLFTIIWTFVISITFARLKLLPNWINVLGCFSSFIYLLAQAELFATVIPGFPVWNMAGLIGSTLWLTWLLIMGIKFLQIKNI